MGILHAIESKATAEDGSGNPYRAILRREYPEPLIALLAFILGIWLWDHYFGKKEGYAPETEMMAMLRVDRDLRMADAMAHDPRWLRWLSGVERPEEVRKDAIRAFEQLAAEDSLGPRGLEAYAVVFAAHRGEPVLHVLGRVFNGDVPTDHAACARELAEGRGTWWQARTMEAWEKTLPPSDGWRDVYAESLGTLRSRAIFAGSSSWLIGLAGLAFLPATLRCLARAPKAKARGYSGGWPPSLGILIFLAATLAWIGFSMTLDLGVASLPGLHPLMGILLDTAARLLPACIAVALLFKRPSHAVRVLGLARGLFPGQVLGLFSLLLLVDLLLRRWLGGLGEVDPAGGLSMIEAGGWGLALAIVSACMIAPLAEEILYRGVLFRSLGNPLGVLPAALISSVVFAALHFYNVYGLASVGVFGFACAILYASTGSLAAAVALHVLYNAAIKIPEWIIYHAPV